MRTPTDRRLSRSLFGAVALVALLQITNDALPYLGLRDDSCQTMFSGLDWYEGGNNHLFMPQRMASDLWVFYVDVDAEVAPPPTERRTRALTAWLQRDGLQHNAEAIRVAVRQLCDEGHTVTLTYREKDGPLHERVDACRAPRLSRPHGWIPVRLYDSHYPWPWPEGPAG